MKYGSYPKNADFYDLPIEYEQRVFKKRPIYCLINNILERLKVSYIEQYFDNIIYEINTQNAYFEGLTFDGDERLITRLRIYYINGDIIFRLKYGSIINV